MSVSLLHSGLSHIIFISLLAFQFPYSHLKMFVLHFYLFSLGAFVRIILSAIRRSGNPVSRMARLEKSLYLSFGTYFFSLQCEGISGTQSKHHVEREAGNWTHLFVHYCLLAVNASVCVLGISVKNS